MGSERNIVQKANMLLIDGNRDERVVCPMGMNFTDSTLHCTPQCAWFNISLERDPKLSNGVKDVYSEYAFCKDTRIGKLITEEPKESTDADIQGKN